MTCNASLRPAGAFLLAVLSFPNAVAGQQTLTGREFEDQTHGFRLTIPKDWVRMPTNVDERWVVARFQSKRNYFGNIKRGDSGGGVRAVMKVVMFDAAAIKRTKKSSAKPTAGLPYRDYKDFVKRNNKEGGYYFVQEEEGSHRDRPVVQYQIKFEKLVADRKRYITWLFRGKGVAFAVEIDILEEQVDKLRNRMVNSLKSFKLIPRSAERPKTPVRVKVEDYTWKEWSKLPSAKRFSIREEMDVAREKKMLATLPQGWKASRSKFFLVITHTNAKYTKQVTAAANSFRAWLERRFGLLSDECPMRGVIRICANDEEYRSYHDSSSQTWHDAANREIVLYNDRSPVSISSGGLFYEIFGFFMWDKAPELFYNAPAWLRSGLHTFVATAYLKGRKPIFLRSVTEFVDFAKLRRMPSGSIKTAAEMFRLTTTGIGEKDRKALAELELGSQCATFYRFLEGPGRRIKPLKGRDFVLDYMKKALELAKELDRKSGLHIWEFKQAKSEAEEEGQAARNADRWKRYLALVKKRRQEFLDELNKRTCQWTPEEWASLEKHYARFHKKKTR